MERFICDAMLGKLAKWLRVLGYDTFYDAKADDNEIIRRSWLDGRTIVTRDTRLAARNVARRHLLVLDDAVEGQLRQVIGQLGLTVGGNAFSRCLCCNQVLKSVDKESVRGAVPPYVFATQSSFSRCPDCGKYYWQGTHWQRMVETLRAIAASGPGADDRI